MAHPRYQLLLKEIELLNGNVKNLDDLIHKTKNFGIVLWGGSVSILIGQPPDGLDNVHVLLLMTGIIPILFWMMDYQWRKHLLLISQREKVISSFVNGDAFDEWLSEGHSEPRFPLYDMAGWIYVKGMQGAARYGDAYLVDRQAVARFWRVLLYKEAKWFYSIMIVISISVSVMMWPVG